MKQYNLNEITNEAICLGHMSREEAYKLGKHLVETLCGKAPADAIECMFEDNYGSTWYLRHLNNSSKQHWVVSNYANGFGKPESINIIQLDAIAGYRGQEETTHNGYTVGKYYVYKKNGAPPKKGHKTYEDAKAEINRIRTADVSARCCDFMIFKCVGINYAELEYKEIREE